MADTTKKTFKQKLVTLGGGTGHFSILRGLIDFNDPELITAIVGNWDSGGSSGKLRTEMGILPPGDMRQCLLALMEDPLQRQVAQKLFDDRMADMPGPLQGHSIGNLIAASLEKIYKGPDRGVEAERLLFRIRAKVLPVSLTDLHLMARLKNGQEIEGETNIDLRGKDKEIGKDEKILRVYFDTPADPNPDALKAIEEADRIIFAPGDLYTSILPHLLVNGLPEAIVKSKAKVILALNLMSKRGETDGFKASDFLRTFIYHLGSDIRIDYMVANIDSLDKDILKIYKEEGQQPVDVDEEECLKLAPGIKIIKTQLAAYHLKEHLLRHDPSLLAKAILEID